MSRSRWFGIIAMVVALGLLNVNYVTAVDESATPSARAGLPTCGETATSPATQVATPTIKQFVSTPIDSDILQEVVDIPLPGNASRFDYQGFDPNTGRLYIAHMGAGELVVFDTKSRKVIDTIGDLPKVTGVLAVPELDRVYVSVAGDHQVAVIDVKSLKVIARLGTISFPDGLDYAPESRRLFVSDESGGGEMVIDAVANKVLTSIDVGGEAGNTHFDADSGCILVAVQNRNQIVAIDPASNHVVEQFDLNSGCQGPHGFLVDALARLAFVGCEDNAKLLVVNLVSMDVTATYQVGDTPDVLAFDPGLRRLYVASESGKVSVFDERGGDLQPSGEISIPHAHSVAVDPSSHLVYFPLENVDGRPVLRIMTPAIGD